MVTVCLINLTRKGNPFYVLLDEIIFPKKTGPEGPVTLLLDTGYAITENS